MPMRLSIQQLPRMTADQLAARIRTVCLLLICGSLVGCSAYPLGFARKSRQECFYPTHGVDDHLFHGHRKTCWRNWNDPAWQAIPCPDYSCPLPVAGEIPIPTYTAIQQEHRPAPVMPVPAMPDTSDLQSSRYSSNSLTFPPAAPPAAPTLDDVR